VCKYVLTEYGHRDSSEVEYIQCSWYNNGIYEESPTINTNTSSASVPIPRGATDIRWYA
jgi:hypothetical protein